MRKKLPALVGLRISIGILLLAMAPANARADAGDDYQAAYLRAHPGFHGFLTPHPPYPLQVRMTHAQGTVQVRVSFAAKGNVEDVAILRSSNSQILDGNTINYIKGRRRNLTGKRAARTQTLDYHLRQ